MKKLTSQQIRATFLSYFKEQGHHIVESSSLVPQEDPTLLFTNAGMNQFKDTFLGLEKRNYVKAASSQKCVRAGGSITIWRMLGIPRDIIPSLRC